MLLKYNYEISKYLKFIEEIVKPTDILRLSLLEKLERHELCWKLSSFYDCFTDGEPDYRKCSIKLISAFREGEFGAITLDEI